ncbi:hypothetical protein GOODEAATRI_033170, partial [Goodea atripinnis]
FVTSCGPGSALWLNGKQSEECGGKLKKLEGQRLISRIQGKRFLLDEALKSLKSAGNDVYFSVF